MGWNGSDRRGNSTPVQPKAAAKKPSPIRGLVAGGLVCVLAVGAYLVFFAGSENSKTERVEKDRGRIRESEPAKVPKAAPATKSRADKIKKVKEELNDKVKEFIKKADTNHTVRLGPAPLDPDDPDNALRTQTMTEVAMLVGITPGDPIPPVPFSFMMDDAIMEEASRKGDAVVVFDGGNKRFKEELEKWKITIKETDSEQRAAKKQEMLESQLELLKGLDEGISVNDSIRAAYEFRKQAHEIRCELKKTITELHDADPDVDITKELVRKANEKLAADGIKKIAYQEIMPDYEEEEQAPKEEQTNEE